MWAMSYGSSSIAFLKDKKTDCQVVLGSYHFLQKRETVRPSLVPNRISRLCKDFEKLHCPYLVCEVSSQ